MQFTAKPKDQSVSTPCNSSTRPGECPARVPSDEKVAAVFRKRGSFWSSWQIESQSYGSGPANDTVMAWNLAPVDKYLGTYICWSQRSTPPPPIYATIRNVIVITKRKHAQGQFLRKTWNTKSHSKPLSWGWNPNKKSHHPPQQLQAFISCHSSSSCGGQ